MSRRDDNYFERAAAGIDSDEIERRFHEAWSREDRKQAERRAYLDRRYEATGITREQAWKAFVFVACVFVLAAVVAFGVVL